MFCTLLVTLILSGPDGARKYLKLSAIAVISLVISFDPAWADETQPMPSVEVVESAMGNGSQKDRQLKAELANLDSIEATSNLKSESPVPPVHAETEQCRALLVNQDIEERYQKIQKSLESDYKEGLPKQLKIDLMRVREDIDGLTSKLFDVNNRDPQEVNHIVQLTIDYLEKMISLLPKAHRLAPVVRDRYVVPFTNMNSIRAEHQECLMQAAIEDLQNKEPASKPEPESSHNIYRKLTRELERLNESLYTLQTTDVQRFISYRADLLKQLENYNRNQSAGDRITAKIPQVLNTVHNEIERLLPGLELSKNYYSIVD